MSLSDSVSRRDNDKFVAFYRMQFKADIMNLIHYEFAITVDRFTCMYLIEAVYCAHILKNYVCGI